MLGAGTVINPMIKVITTVAILAAVGIFIVSPVLDTTEKAIDSVNAVGAATGIEQGQQASDARAARSAARAAPSPTRRACRAPGRRRRARSSAASGRPATTRPRWTAARTWADARPHGPVGPQLRPLLRRQPRRPGRRRGRRAGARLRQGRRLQAGSDGALPGRSPTTSCSARLPPIRAPEGTCSAPAQSSTRSSRSSRPWRSSPRSTSSSSSRRSTRPTTAFESFTDSFDGFDDLLRRRPVADRRRVRLDQRHRPPRGVHRAAINGNDVQRRTRSSAASTASAR